MRKDHVLEDLLDIATTKLGHPTDAIRHQANDILINILKIGDLIGNSVCIIIILIIP